jgi:hypothetical protein
MLSPFIYKRPNNNLRDFCMDLTKKSVNKITDKYNLEKNNFKYINPLDKEIDFNNNFIYYSIFGFIFYALSFYRRLQ